MVANITFPHSILETLNYNEKKVQKGTAKCIGEGNLLADHDKLNFYQKLAHFENRNTLNDRAITKTLHVSLNFSPTENPSLELLNEIAATYMEKIGFGTQPYLVYQHHDAAHPHIHIVSTTIREDGSRINTHNIGKDHSEPARKEIEEKYGLVKAENQDKNEIDQIKPLDLKKVQYGKSETKRSITNILNAVVDHYNYTSLPEFNAILRQYNVMADPGKENGYINKKGGLLYRVIDLNGVTIGVPIKASAINNKPTLARLERRFAANEATREALRRKLKNILDQVLIQKLNSFRDFIEKLQVQQVYTLIRQNDEGRMYGVTFVDNRNKSVFNGSALGKGYSIANLQDKILNGVAQNATGNSGTGNTNAKTFSAGSSPAQHAMHLKTEGLIEILMVPEFDNANVPFPLKKKRKKKRKR